MKDLQNHAFKLVNTPPWNDVVNKLHVVEGWQKLPEEERQRLMTQARNHPLSKLPFHVQEERESE